MAHCICGVGGQLAGDSHFSSPAMRVLGIKHRSLDLAASPFTRWTILQACWDIYRRLSKRLWPLISHQTGDLDRYFPKCFWSCVLCHLKESPRPLWTFFRSQETSLYYTHLDFFFLTLPGSSPSLATRVLVTVFSSSYLKSFQGKQLP